MASFDQIATIADSTTFQRRVKYILHKICIEVLGVPVAERVDAEFTLAKTYLAGGTLPYLAILATVDSLYENTIDPDASPDYGVTDAQLEAAVDTVFVTLSQS
jgi:hypothetical protein